MMELVLGVAHRSGHVLSLVIADRGIGFRRIPGTAKVNEQHGGPQFEKDLRFRQCARLLARVAMKQDDQRTANGDSARG